MKISRFFGITTREAMRQVRLALGPDALIVSNRRVAGGVEILATDSSDFSATPSGEPVQSAPGNLAVPTTGQTSAGPQPGSAGAGYRAAPTPLHGSTQATGAHASGVATSAMGASAGNTGTSPDPTASGVTPVRVPAGGASPGTTPAPSQSSRPSMFSSTSRLGAYAAAFQAAYGEMGKTETAPGVVSPAASVAPATGPTGASVSSSASATNFSGSGATPIGREAIPSHTASTSSGASTAPPGHAHSSSSMAAGTSVQPADRRVGGLTHPQRAPYVEPVSDPSAALPTYAAGSHPSTNSTDNIGMTRTDAADAAANVEISNQARAAASVSVPTEPVTAAGRNQPPDIMDAIGAMRGALESRIDDLLWGNQLRRVPQAATLFQNLLGFGFSTELLRSLLKQLPEHLTGRAALDWVRQQLTDKLPVLTSEDELWKPGLVLALVGPTGVGKTTTIAKLAARCVRRFGPDKLVLITTDTYRIGAHEQLRIYGEMLRVPVHVVRSAEELKAVVSDVRPDQVILIDNVGISQRDRYITEQAALLAAAGRDVTRVLALNAASHGETLDEVARSYSSDGGTPLRGCIITKVDEAIRLGAVLDTVIRYQLPIHYVSIGQKVPEHMVFLRATELVDQALTNLPSARNLYAPSEADLAALMAVTPSAAATHDENVAARRVQMHALPRLLSLAGGRASKLTPQDLKAGCEFVDEMACASEAYRLWRLHEGGEGTDSTGESEYLRMLRVARNAWSESGQQYLLAVHDHTGLRAPDEPSAALRATLLLDGQGNALTSPLQQLALPSGWLSSGGVARIETPTAAEALVEQVEWLRQQGADSPIVHVFEGGNPGLWHALSQSDVRWMAQVPAITRIFMDDGSTTVQAYAKTLEQQLVVEPPYLYALAEVAGGPVSDRVLWAATAPVRINRRGADPLMLHMVSARLVEKSTGKEVRRVIGLHAGLDIPLNQLATWLVVKSEAREVMRHAASAWGLLAGQGASAATDLQRALVATQSGLAAWQLCRHPLAAQGRELAGVMIGKKSVPVAAAASTTFRLFALKDMLGAG